MSKKKILILILGLVLLFFHICTFAFSDVISKIVSKHESKLKIGDDIQSITKKEDLPDNLVKDLEITAKESEDLVEEEKFLNDLMIELSDNFNDFPELQSRIENVCK